MKPIHNAKFLLEILKGVESLEGSTFEKFYKEVISIPEYIKLWNNYENLCHYFQDCRLRDNHLELAYEGIYQSGGISINQLNSFRKTLIKNYVDLLEDRLTNEPVDLRSNNLDYVVKQAMTYRLDLENCLGVRMDDKLGGGLTFDLDMIKYIEALANKVIHKSPGISIHYDPPWHRYILDASILIFDWGFDDISREMKIDSNRKMDTIGGARSEVTEILPI